MPKKIGPKGMPKFTPAPASLVRIFESTLKDFPMAERRKMFGYPAALIQGRMFASLFRNEMTLRLAEAERSEFLQKFKTRRFEVMPGRPMKEYVVVPKTMLGSPATLKRWVAKAMAYTQSLPPK